jgi:hypothetical protein
VSLHGMMDQTLRSASLSKFKNQVSSILIATDVASRFVVFVFAFGLLFLLYLCVFMFFVVAHLISVSFTSFIQSLTFPSFFSTQRSGHPVCGPGDQLRSAQDHLGLHPQDRQNRQSRCVAVVFDLVFFSFCSCYFLLHKTFITILNLNIFPLLLPLLGRTGRAISFVTQYDISLVHDIEEYTTQKMTLSEEVTETDVIPLLNTVSKAMREAQMKSLDDGNDEKVGCCIFFVCVIPCFLTRVV